LELITYTERGGEKAVESSFVTALKHIVHPQKERHQATQYAAHQAAKPKLVRHPNSVTSRDQLRVQLAVTHTTFGAGTIVELDEERIVIQFAEESKRLALAPCLDNGLLLLERGEH
jgi:DNA helicase-2/ATP-dependent DNA helicase PcrA